MVSLVMRLTMIGLIAFGMERASAAPQATPETVSVASAYLLTEDEVPDGLVMIQDGERTLADVVSGFADPDATAARFRTWGWQGNAVRAFHTSAGEERAPEAIDGIYMSVHVFGSSESAAEALDYSADAHRNGGALDELPDPGLGDRSRTLYGSLPYGNEVTYYVQQGNVLVRLSAASPEGDPRDEAAALMSLVLDRELATPSAA